MAGASYDIVVLSSSPPAHDLYAPSSPLNGSPISPPRRVAMPAAPLPALSPSASPRRNTSGASALGSRKADIPPDAIRGFATVGSLVRSEHFAQHFDDDIAGKDQEQSRKKSPEDVGNIAATKKKPGKRAATTSTADGEAKPKPKPRARKPKAADEEAVIIDPELRLPAAKVSPFFAAEGAPAAIEPSDEPVVDVPKLTKAGKPRKPRAKKENVGGEEAVPKPKRTRVTKPKAAKAKAGGKSQEEACVESAHFRKSEDTGDETVAGVLATRKSATTENVGSGEASIWDVPQSPKPKKKRAPKKPPPDPVINNLELDEAVSRRRDWTPPRDTAIPSPFTDSVGKENKQIEPDADNGGFTHMISNFAYAQALPAQVASTVADSATGTMAATKRRRIELLDVPGNQTTSRNSSPEKGKAPKKKPRTITDIATEQYQHRAAQLDQSDVASDFFQSHTAVTKVPLNDASLPNGDAPTKKPPRKRSTSKPASEKEKVGSKARSKKASTKAAAKPKHIAEKLLSPGSALMRMNKQDILFGTSSQLALEEPPTLVRQLQHALKESEVEADLSSNGMIAPPPRWPKLDKVVGKRSLWDASSRDVEGGMLEHMEDVYIPEFDRTQDFPLLMDGTNDQPDGAPPSFADIDDFEPAPPVIISSDGPTPPPTTSRTSQRKANDEPDHVMEGPVFEDIDDFDFQPPPSNQNVEFQDSFADDDEILHTSVQSSTHPPPRLRPPATSDPMNGSSKKPRGCPAKSQSAIATSGSPAVAKEPKRTKGKEVKSAPAPPTTPAKGSGRFIDIDEILDSDDEALQALSPTPPRIHNFENSQPLPLYSVSPTRAKKPKADSSVDSKIVPVHIIPTAHLEWLNLKNSIFPSITSHIRSLPSTRDPSKPSWHEKILMYDPIVLEDFTAYLNAKTSLRTWRRATKIQSKAWNKAQKSIGAQEIGVVEGGGNVLAVEKELEAWQVQSWCESMSVCCIWGEGRGKGGVRKGFY
ncbi:structure-specific endonuclease subunit SLX4 [Parastagonospora nodorum]|nr:structure-specific endonuclease subunit SLX4 [Parastagonospora nodorum]KAH6237280.1 structure-specific endonuclease subunit SLX4 [Parastagonospora nodorum]KAH6553424.1 structure-specific endonuclease subunit SLX4 [Parastagonospora nodorum]